MCLCAGLDPLDSVESVLLSFECEGGNLQRLLLVQTHSCPHSIPCRR